MKRFIRPAAVLSIACLSVFLASCGGGGSGSHATGRFALTVKWPEPSRLIPAGSNSIKAVLTAGSTQLGQQILVRPQAGPWTTTVTFSSLQPGSVTLTATAFPNANATGTAQATGSSNAAIVADQTTAITVTMASKITTVDVTPSPSTIQVGGTVQLTATPKDAGGNVVLVAPGNITWVSGAPATAGVNASGLVTGIVESATPATITATESESQKSGTAAVTVAAAAPPADTGAVDTAVDRTGKFLYVADNRSSTVSQFSINADGTLSPLSPATVSVALGPQTLRVNPAAGSNTLYVGATDNETGAIYQFHINVNGTLTPLSPATAPSTSQPIVLVIDPAGKFLFGIDHNEGIRQFIINADGTLTQNGSDVLSTNGNQLFSAAVTPDGKFLYTSGGPQAWKINANGTLSFIGLGPSGSGNAEGMSIDPSGKNLYVTFATVGGGGIDIYTINADGSLTTNGPAVPFSLDAYRSVITPNGKFLYVVAIFTPNNVVAQYAINANGTITALSPATVAAGGSTRSVSISPDGKYVYVTNNGDNTVSQFRVNANGTLTALSPPSVPG